MCLLKFENKYYIKKKTLDILKETTNNLNPLTPQQNPS